MLGAGRNAADGLAAALAHVVRAGPAHVTKEQWPANLVELPGAAVAVPAGAAHSLGSPEAAGAVRIEAVPAARIEVAEAPAVGALDRHAPAQPVGVLRRCSLFQSALKRYRT